MPKFQNIDEAQRAFQQNRTTARSRGQLNIPQNLDTSGFKPGETLYSLAFDPLEQQQLQNRVGQLTSNSSKRDIPQGLVGSFFGGQISLEELERQISGTPTFNQNIGPQIDTGQGKRSLSAQEQSQLNQGVPIGTIVSSRLPREQFEQNVQTIGQAGDASSKENLRNKAIKALADDGFGNPDEKEIQGKVQELKLQQKSTGVVTAQSSNEQFNIIRDKVNEIIAQAQEIPGFQLSDESKALLSQVNNIQDKQDAAVLSGQASVNTKDITGANTSSVEIKEMEVEKKKVIGDLMTSLSDARRKLLDNLGSSPETKNAKAQVADIERQIRNKKSSIQAGVDTIEGQPVPMAFIIGQAREVSKLGERQLTRLQDEYATSVGKLGLSQEEDKLRALKANKVLDFAKEDIEFQTQMDDKIAEREQDVLDSMKDLEKDARTLASQLFKTMEGVSFNDLNGDEQEQLLDTLQNAGIPFGAFAKGLETQKAKFFADLSRTESLTNASSGKDKKGDFANLNAVMSINTDKTDAELRAWGQANTDLNDSEIDDAIATRIGDFELNIAAEVLLADAFETSFFDNSETEIQTAKARAKGKAERTGIIDVGDKKMNMSDPEMKQRVFDAIEGLTLTKDELKKLKNDKVTN